MRIATLGYDRDLLALVQYIQASQNHELVACFEASDGSTDLREIVPASVELSESWEALLSGTVADIIVVAARPQHASRAATRDEQLRKLVQASTPLILVQPSCQMIIGYELEMIRHDSDCLMIPYHPTLYHSRYQALCELVGGPASTSFGTVEQLVWERQASDRRQASVLEDFTRDAFVLRDLLGNVTHVAAMGAAGGDNVAANLGVHLTGESDRLARWSIGPVRESAGAKLTVIGSKHSASLMMPSDSFAFELVLDGVPQDGPPNATSPPERIFRDAEQRLGSSQTNGTGWEQACRALELEDAVERSLRRGRTIELHHEMVTERETFKSMMAAGGCGLLLWVLLLLLVAGVVEGLQLPIRDSFAWKLWPLFLFAPLAVFLFLQLFQLAMAKRESQNSDPSQEDRAS